MNNNQQGDIVREKLTHEQIKNRLISSLGIDGYSIIKGGNCLSHPKEFMAMAIKAKDPQVLSFVIDKNIDNQEMSWYCLDMLMNINRADCVGVLLEKHLQSEYFLGTGYMPVSYIFKNIDETNLSIDQKEKEKIDVIDIAINKGLSREILRSDNLFYYAKKSDTVRYILKIIYNNEISIKEIDLAKCHDLDNIKLLSSMGADIQAKKSGKNLLHYFCIHKDIMQYLLDCGLYIENIGIHNNLQTPMFSVCDAQNNDCLELLISRGANVNHIDKDGRSALFGVTDEDIMRTMINAGADVNITDYNHNNLISYLDMQKSIFSDKDLEPAKDLIRKRQAQIVKDLLHENLTDIIEIKRSKTRVNKI